MTRERGSPAESKNCEFFSFQPLIDVLTRKSNAPPELNVSQMPEDCPGGGWAILELTGT